MAALPSSGRSDSHESSSPPASAPPLAGSSRSSTPPPAALPAAAPPSAGSSRSSRLSAPPSLPYRFCPGCGGGLEKTVPPGDHAFRLVCSSCHFIFYQNPKPTASILLLRGGKVLLVRRAIEPAKGEWDLPGGFIEEDEHPESAVKREMKEELGLEIQIESLLGIFMDLYGYGGGSTLNIYYTGTIRSGSPSPRDDISEYAWFSAEELPAKMAFQNNTDALRQWKERSTGDH